MVEDYQQQSQANQQSFNQLKNLNDTNEAKIKIYDSKLIEKKKEIEKLNENVLNLTKTIESTSSSSKKDITKLIEQEKNIEG